MGVSSTKPALKRVVLLLLLIAAGLVGLVMNEAAQKDNERANKIAATKDPGELARLILDNSDANLTATHDGRTLNVEYDIDPWALTNNTIKSMFEYQVKQIVPAIFSRFLDIDDIQITANAQFQTLRGDEYHSPALRIEFTRSNATTVHWDNVLSENLPLVADGFWQHPSPLRGFPYRSAPR